MSRGRRGLAYIPARGAAQARPGPLRLTKWHGSLWTPGLTEARRVRACQASAAAAVTGSGIWKADHLTYLWISRHILRTTRDILCYTTSRLVQRCLSGHEMSFLAEKTSLDIPGYLFAKKISSDISRYPMSCLSRYMSVYLRISNFLCRYISIYLWTCQQI